MKRVVVIGAGLGGLAAAIRLARSGHEVVVLEKNEHVGGKVDSWESDGFVFDTGPTLLTMPFVLRDLWEAAGRRLEGDLTIVPLDPLCRYFFPDGSRLDTTTDAAAMEREIARFRNSDAEGFKAFMRHARAIYEAAAEPFLFSAFTSLRFGGLMRQLRNLPALLRLDAMRTLDQAVSSFVEDPRLRQLLNRFATYNGSSPFRAPATLAIIPHVELSMGGWYVKGGMRRLASALGSIAKDVGVLIRVGAEVESLLVDGRRVSGVLVKGGESLNADAVVCNADAIYAHRNLVAPATGRRRTFDSAGVSLGGFVLLLGVKGEFPHLAQHNIFFSSDYRAEFESLFDRARPHGDPTIYVSISARSDPSHAPTGCSNLFVLVNAPPLGPRVDWVREASAYRTLVIQSLERRGLTSLSDAIVTERVLTPLDFERRFHAFRGSIYGTSSNNRMAAFLRPPNRSRDLRGLFFAGGSAHPGGGIPLVLLSGKIAAELAQEELQ